MTLNDRHINKTSFTPSPAHTALKKAARLIGIIAGLTVGVLLWAILKPIFRGVACQPNLRTDDNLLATHFIKLN